MDLWVQTPRQNAQHHAMDFYSYDMQHSSRLNTKHGGVPARRLDSIDLGVTTIGFINARCGRGPRLCIRCCYEVVCLRHHVARGVKMMESVFIELLLQIDGYAYQKCSQAVSQ